MRAEYFRRSRFPISSGGLLTFESDWSPALDQPLVDALAASPDKGRLDLGCVAAHGSFGCDDEECYTITPQGKARNRFSF
jgi:hypothetical protein